MRVDLVELLRAREIGHPCRLLRLESSCDSDLRIEVAGYPWWLQNLPHDREERITFHLEGITGGLFDSDLFHADCYDEDLESFDAGPLSAQAWAEGVHCDVYCSSPLPNALDVYASLQDVLLALKCPYSPGHYLNMGNSESFTEFVAIASSGSFLLCRGPEAGCNAVCGTLKRSGVAFNVVRGKDLSRGLIYVRLQGSHWICRSAYAVFNGRR
jgi:hypothetical protein